MIDLPKSRSEEGLSLADKMADISDDVLVKVTNVKNLCIGRYIHGCDMWQINGFHGEWEVSEWWELPKEGTGHNSILER